MKKCRRLICLALVTLSLLLLPACHQQADPDALPQVGDRLYVLMYHHLVEQGENLNAWTITKDRFEEDLKWLQEHGYTTYLPSQLAELEQLPEKAVLITFDDGYTSNYHIAFPLLKQYDSKAVIAVIAKRIEDQNPEFLSWEMCREMSQSGYVEIGSHTYDLHHHGTGIARLEKEFIWSYRDRVLSDLEESIRLIRDHTGAEVTYFAHPHGQTDRWANSFLKKNFLVTTTSEERAADISRGMYLLPRYNISMDRPLSDYLEA